MCDVAERLEKMGIEKGLKQGIGEGIKQRKPEIGTRQDLVLYRLETAKNDLKSARALFAMEDYRGANNRAY